MSLEVRFILQLILMYCDIFINNMFFLISKIGSNNEAQNFLSRSGQVIVRMRGLPYDCTAKQVVSQRTFNLYMSSLFI